MNCSICNDPIERDYNGWDKGHNAQPLNDGRCCSICNDTIVVPARLSLFFRKNKRTEEVQPELPLGGKQ